MDYSWRFNISFTRNLFEQQKFPKISKFLKIIQLVLKLLSSVFFLHICDVEMGASFAPKIAKLVEIRLEKHIFPKFPPKILIHQNP
jgi:hypothetical protein